MGFKKNVAKIAVDAVFGERNSQTFYRMQQVTGQQTSPEGIVTAVDGTTLTVLLSTGDSITAYATTIQKKIGDKTTVIGSRAF
jgi:hypothetical protein